MVQFIIIGKQFFHLIRVTAIHGIFHRPQAFFHLDHRLFDGKHFLVDRFVRILFLMLCQITDRLSLRNRHRSLIRIDLLHDDL